MSALRLSEPPAQAHALGYLATEHGHKVCFTSAVDPMMTLETPQRPGRMCLSRDDDGGVSWRRQISMYRRRELGKPGSFLRDGARYG